MRRPPDTQPPTSNEVASSNSTLNAFLGGRQKSWMTVGGSNIRPTPRDPTRASTSSASFPRNSAATVLPSPAPSDEPSPVQHLTESPAAELQSEQTHPAPPPPQQSPHQQQQEQTPQLQQSPRQQPPQQRQQSLQQQQSPQTTHQQPRSTVAQSPPTQNQDYQNSNRAQNSAQVQHPHKRKRTMPPNPSPPVSSTPTLASRVMVIDEHIRASGFQNLNVPIERPRFSLLREACTMDDFFYVALHQIFCTWSVNQNSVLQLTDFSDHETLSIAFKILSQLIRDNSGLTFQHLEWFTQFPAPLQNLIASSDLYRKHLASVSLFLTRLRTHWGALTLKCQERCYPPLCDELVSTLNLLSPVLQNVFFTATRRNLNIQDDKYGHAMEALFVKDRSDFRSLAARMETDRPPTEKEMTFRKSKLIGEYLKLNKQRIQEESTARPLQPAGPRPASNGAVPQQQQHPMPQRIPQQHSRSNSYSQVPGSAQLQYSHQEPNIQANGHHSYPFPGQQAQAAAQQLETMQQYQAINSPNQVYNGPGSAPNISAGYGYMPAVVPSNVASPVERSYPSGFHQSPPNGYPAQLQQVQAQQHHQQQHQGSWIRESQEQEARLRQVLLQQQVQQQQQALQPHHQLRQQNMMQRPQIRGVVTSNVPPTNSRQSSVSSPYLQTANAAYFPTLGSTPNGGTIRKDEEPFIPHLSNVPLTHNQPPRPDYTALHQAHVRSPRLQTGGLNSKVPTKAEERFYQAVKAFVVHPVALPTDRTLSTYEFTMTEATWSKVARTIWPGPGELATRNVSGGSLQYRFRCVQLGPDNKVPNDNDWINAETKWPEALFVEINRNQLELRRKFHHGKDLPVDITTFVKPTEKGVDGLNAVKVSFLRKTRQGEPNYAIAVEVTEVLQHKAITDMVLKTQRIPGSETLSDIMSKLSVSLDDDDDIAIVASDLTIDLADPYTARIFETPVRGVTCLHRECFDLETFLSTRNSKPKRPEQPCMVDQWKCPLCSRDVRPYSLRVDEFLLSVRAELAERKLLDCKAIIVSADGSWRPKPEPKPSNHRNNKRNASSAGMDDDDSDDANENEIRKTPATSKGPEPEVIELDSD